MNSTVTKAVPIRRASRMLAASLAVGMAAYAASAVVAPLEASADPCGYYETRVPTIKYYNHCGSRPVVVKLTVQWGFDQNVCLPPGTTNLSKLEKSMRITITYAKSKGSSCN